MGITTMTAPTEVAADVCVRCRKGHVDAVAVDGVYAHEGESVTYKDEFMRCDHCGREFYTPDQSMARSRAITTALRKHQGFLIGEEIRDARLSYGLNLPEFEKALGVGKNTVGRWERGTVPPIGAANFGLWAAANAPDAFEKWAALRGVKVKKRPARAATLAGTTSSAPSIALLRDDVKLTQTTHARVRSPESNLALAAAGGGPA